MLAATTAVTDLSGPFIGEDGRPLEPKRDDDVVVLLRDVAASTPR